MSIQFSPNNEILEKDLTNDIDFLFKNIIDRVDLKVLSK